MASDRPPHDYIPIGPLETTPGGGFRDPETRREAFAAVLAGVETGAYGQRIIDWLCDLDDPTCRTVACLLWQARLAGRAEALPEGTVTRWAVTYSDENGQHTQPYPGEDMARGAAAQVRAISPDVSAVVVSRQVTPWTEAPETTEPEDGDDG